MSQGTNLAEMFHLSGVCIGCLLNDKRPADLPVQQATDVQLVVRF
jgi:hypothetical protein